MNAEEKEAEKSLLRWILAFVLLKAGIYVGIHFLNKKVNRG